MFLLRALEPKDVPVLSRFLALASHEEDIAVVLGNPHLARYVERWGRCGDEGVVAQELASGTIIGTAWVRLWTADNYGFAWVDEQTPELAGRSQIPLARSSVGTLLVQTLKQHLQQAGTRRLALSVRADSPAVRLYERLGFREQSGSQRQNRVGDISSIMVCDL